VTRVDRPQSLKHLLRLTGEHPNAALLAGGASVMAAIRAGRRPAHVIDLSSVSELRGVERQRKALWIGAQTTIEMVCADRFAQRHHPTLVQACATEVPQQQARSTLGGCIVLGRREVLPVLLSLDTRIELRSAGRSRTIPIDGLRAGLRSGELVTSAVIPHPHPDDRAVVRVLRGHGGLCLAARVRKTEGVVTAARVAAATREVGAQRYPDVERALVGEPIRPGLATLLEPHLGKVAVNVLRSWLECLL
jgi:CO/xanthine dehydrogenase FAD-binding subunit